MLNFKHGILLLLIPFFTSCLTYKNTAYLQDVQDEAPFEAFINKEYHLQVGDIVYVRFLSIDEAATDMFNLTSARFASSSGNGSTAVTGNVIDPNGQIDLPFIGFVHAKGLTIRELKIKIKKELAKFVEEGADVVVKHVQQTITILGEVKSPGQKEITRENITIYEALSLAGDVSDFGDRTRIRVIRRKGDEQLVRTFSILDKQALQQPNVIQPNDILYIEPMKAKIYGFKTIPWGLMFSTVSTTILLLRYFDI